MKAAPALDIAGEVDPLVSLRNQLAQRQALLQAYYSGSDQQRTVRNADAEGDERIRRCAVSDVTGVIPITGRISRASLSGYSKRPMSAQATS